MPVTIPAELVEFIKGKQGWVATAAKDGTPNLSIKGSLRVLDEEHLVFADLSSLKTRRNLEENRLFGNRLGNHLRKASFFDLGRLL
jgi:hypothetical protein